MATNLVRVFLASLLVLSSACSRGLIYTDSISPKCKDLRGTTLGTQSVRGGSFRVAIPTSRVNLTSEWSSTAIGEVAKNYGIKTVHSCDLRTLSVLAGIFRKEEIIIYGD